MFVSFLYPFRLRGREAPFLWVAYKQIGDLDPSDIAFLASEAYFQDPNRYRDAGRFECHAPVNPELGFRVPTAEAAGAAERFPVPEVIYRRLKQSLRADTLVWLHLIRECDPALVEWFCHCLDGLKRRAPVEALLTWCNCAALSAAGAALGIPVLNCELGPLRDPWYLPLGYLDFQGVNGGTEAARRWQQAPSLPAEHDSIGALRRLLSRRQTEHLPADEAPMPIGVPLQVEDDSNVLAYGNGFDMYQLFQYAAEAYEPDQILVRPHPGAHLRPPAGWRLDDSPTSASFISRCQSLLSLNSSVAVEAMLLERPTVILGDSPATYCAGDRIDAPRRATLAELEFLLLNYCVPYSLLFDAAYLRWRLAGPTEGEIRQRHLAVLRAGRARADRSDQRRRVS
jgi:hypothetical protein